MRLFDGLFRDSLLWPWWANWIAAIVVYVGLRYGLAELALVDPVLIRLSEFAQRFAWTFAAFFFAAGLIAGLSVLRSPLGWLRPACPRCGAPMIERISHSGPHTGQRFWGCSRYPRCHGLRQHRL